MGVSENSGSVLATLPKFNRKTPEKRNGWKLEDYFPFGMVHFQGRCLLNFQGVVGIC